MTETDPGLLDDLNALVEPDTRGDPMSPLRWTCKSLRRLAAELDKLGHKISHTVVGELLKKLGATTTRTGLTVRCELDNKPYPKGIVVSDEDMRNLNIQHADFHCEWNYTIAPSTTEPG